MYNVTRQEEMIGIHPLDGIFAIWVSCKDITCTDTKTHRSLKENIIYRKKAIEEISNYLINHHLSNRQKSLLDKKKFILNKYNLNKYVKELSVFPKADKTKKGNFGEVILTEYLRKTSGIEIMIYKLRYNPNIDQSMKGDDVLLFNENKILLGESKFRTKADKSVVEEISKNFGKELILPISLSFIADRLYEREKFDLSDIVTEIEISLSKRKIDIKNIGLIVSDLSAHQAVEKHMDSNNENFIIITLNINNPVDFLNDSYNRALKSLSEDFAYEY